MKAVNFVLLIVACVLLAVFANLVHASFTTHLPAPTLRVWQDGQYALWLVMTALAMLATVGAAALALSSFRALVQEVRKSAWALAHPAQAVYR